MQGDGAKRNLTGLVLQYHSKTDNFAPQHKSSMEKRLHYIQPDFAIELEHCLYGLLCESPEAGGLEDVEYEEWVTQG